jgi:hypothetical protein
MSLASDHISKAYELRGRVSEREKFAISADYYSLVTQDLEKANQQYEQWIHDYPRDAEAPGKPRPNSSRLILPVDQCAI